MVLNVWKKNGLKSLFWNSLFVVVRNKNKDKNIYHLINPVYYFARKHWNVLAKWYGKPI